MENKPQKPNLPALIIDLGLSVKVDNFNMLLNQTPPASWLKEHKGVRYQPIERVKNNIITLYQDYDWSIKDVRIVANSILVFGTLSVVNPVTGRTTNKDGVGAWPIQLKAGSKPLEIENIIQDAIQKNAPAAESLALKNAASKLGKLFTDGSSDVEFNPIFAREEKTPEPIDPETLQTETDILKALSLGQITKEQSKKMLEALKTVKV